jgi:hypothetical protein
MDVPDLHKEIVPLSDVVSNAQEFSSKLILQN